MINKTVQTDNWARQ